MSATAPTQRARLIKLLQAAGSVETEVESRLNTVGLSIPKLAALYQLVNAGNSLPLGQLAERLACVKSNVTQLVDRLEADGYVARELDPTDRRSRLAVITDAGRAAFEQGVNVQQAVERDIFAPLTDDEADQLMILIRKLDRRCS